MPSNNSNYGAYSESLRETGCTLMSRFQTLIAALYFDRWPALPVQISTRFHTAGGTSFRGGMAMYVSAPILTAVSETPLFCG